MIAGLERCIHPSLGDRLETVVPHLQPIAEESNAAQATLVKSTFENVVPKSRVDPMTAWGKHLGQLARVTATGMTLGGTPLVCLAAWIASAVSQGSTVQYLLFTVLRTGHQEGTSQPTAARCRCLGTRGER